MGGASWRTESVDRETAARTAKQLASKNTNGHNNSLDVCSGNESHELSYGDLQYSTHSESTVSVGKNDDGNDDSHNMDDFSLRKQ